MGKINYVEYYGLIKPKDDSEILKALIQIQEKRECWRPEIASWCRELIQQVINRSKLLPENEKERLGGYACNLLGDLIHLKRKEYFGNMDYENKFYTALNTAISSIKKYDIG